MVLLDQTAHLNEMMQNRNRDSRNDVQIHLWVQYELAARKIQRQFRCWHTARHFRRSYSRKVKVESQYTPAFPAVEEGFRSIISENGSFEDKMVFWRGAIELRRAHKAHNTDQVVRALIESAGDVGRATVLLGTKEFAMVNKGNLPVKLRKMFMPDMVASSRQLPSPHHELMMESLRKTINLNNEMYDTSGGGRLNNVNFIRNLRGTKGKKITYQEDRDERRLELFGILNSVLERSYFSRSHIGNKDYKKCQKLPGNTGIKSKVYLSRHDEFLKSDNLEYLLGKTQTGVV